jgi:two-component system cell cycle response regulator DivK
VTTILIIEDDEMNRDMLSRRLKRRGYEVLVAVDGEMGIELARTKAPDLILMDGWKTTRRLKADPDLEHIPVIGLTAHASDREEAIEAGCDDYDTRPIELTRLLAKMVTLLLGDRPSHPHAASASSWRS